MSKHVYKPSKEAKKVQEATHNWMLAQDKWLEQWTRSMLGDAFVDAHLASNPLIIAREMATMGLTRQASKSGIALMLRDICLDTFPHIGFKYTNKYEKYYSPTHTVDDDVPF